MTDLKTITTSLRAAVDAGDLGAISNGVGALERLTQNQQAAWKDEVLTEDEFEARYPKMER